MPSKHLSRARLIPADANLIDFRKRAGTKAMVISASVRSSEERPISGRKDGFRMTTERAFLAAFTTTGAFRLNSLID